MPHFEDTDPRLAITGSRLFVGGLQYNVTKVELHKFFSAAGTVANVYMAMDPERGENRNRGFAFVQMADERGAERAVSMFHNKIGPGERRIGVKIANTGAPR